MLPHPITREKVEQAIGILQEKNVDAWITFVRETTLTRDPTLGLIVSPALQLTWHSAFILTRRGERIAIVGRFDKENVEAIGAYSEVLTYDQGIGQPLVEALLRLNPESIAINFSD
ncbi:MAG TPA: aminopeptidase P family protein, partial [Anaerolineae bacterium]|nr:aminopeptidase P family protein [Anaerolineae bacterium]